MFAKSLPLLAALFAFACSGSDGQSTPAVQGDSRLFVPEGITASQRVGNNSVFQITALTLEPGSDGLDLYAAVKNDGDVVTCNTSFSVELHDKDDQVVAADVSGLMARGYYRFGDNAGSLAGMVAGCVAPGSVTKLAIKGLSVDPPNADVRSVIFYTTSWANLDPVMIDGVSLSGVASVSEGAGFAYKGTLINGFDTPLANPTVAVFPVNAVGRPLGVTYGSSSVDVPAGGKWDFETDPIEDKGVGFDAYPLGGS